MAVYYKFKSAKDFDSIPIDGHFISIGNLKEKIFETKHLGRGTDFDLVVTNAQNNEGWFCFVLKYLLPRSLFFKTCEIDFIINSITRISIGQGCFSFKTDWLSDFQLNSW